MKREEKKENEKEIRIGANKRREFDGRTKEKKRGKSQKGRNGEKKKRGIFPEF